MYAVPRGHGLDVAVTTRMAEGRAQKEIDMLIDVTKRFRDTRSVRSAMPRRGRYRA